MRRLLLLVPICVASSATIAGAGDAGPTATSASRALRLPDLDRCVVRSAIRVGVNPPAGTDFASLSVRVGDREVLQLADLAGPGSVLVPLRRDGRWARVRATATTSDGEFLSAHRRYRRCRAGEYTAPDPPKPRPERESPGGAGGGEG